MVLLELIDQSLDSLNTSIASSKVITNTRGTMSRSKASKKNNKKKTTTDNNIIVDGIGIVIPFEAAIDLLVSYDISDHVHAVCYDDEKQQQQQQQSILSSIFIKVRHHCEASMDGMLTIDDDHHHALEAVNESLCKAIKVWVSRSIRSDALLLLEGVHTTDAFSELMNVIQWCDDKVIKNVVSLSMDTSPIVSTTTTTIAFNIFMIMLAELSDIIYLHLADHNVYRTITNWIEETMMLGDHYHPTEASVSSLQPLVARLVSLICISPSSDTVATASATTNSNNEDEGKDETWTQKHRLRHVLLKYLLTTITFGKGTNNQKLILALLAANPTVHDDMLRSAAIHVLHAIIQSPDNGDFQSTAHATTISILNQLTCIKLVKQTHKVIIELKSTLHTTTISTNNTCSIHASNEYDAVCKLLTIVEQLSIDRNTTSSSSNSGTQVTAVGKDRSIIQSSALKSAVVPLSSATIDPEHWTTI